MSKKSTEFKLKSLLILMLLAYLFAIPVAYYYLYALPKYNSEKLEFERQLVEQVQTEIKVNRRLHEAGKAKKETELSSCLREAEINLSSRLWADECETWKLQIDLKTVSQGSYILDNNKRCLLPTNLSNNVWRKIREVKEECRKKYAQSC